MTKHAFSYLNDGEIPRITLQEVQGWVAFAKFMEQLSEVMRTQLMQHSPQFLWPKGVCSGQFCRAARLLTYCIRSKGCSPRSSSTEENFPEGFTGHIFPCISLAQASHMPTPEPITLCGDRG
jgi:hypothetical protein